MRSINIPRLTTRYLSDERFHRGFGVSMPRNVSGKIEHTSCLESAEQAEKPRPYISKCRAETAFLVFKHMNLLVTNCMFCCNIAIQWFQDCTNCCQKVVLGAVEWKHKSSRLRSGRCTCYKQIWPKTMHACFCDFDQKHSANHSCAVSHVSNILSFCFLALFYA